MGVKRLWTILEPVGRRVDIATLRGKTLAIDVSIWLASFSYAMRDRDGLPVPHAHLLGTFRRLLKLLFHRIRPVFVFDGGAPTLKRRTLLLRQQQRQNQEARHAQALRRLLLQQLQQRQATASVGRTVAPSSFSAVSLPMAEPASSLQEGGAEHASDSDSDSFSNLATDKSSTAPPLKRLRKASGLQTTGARQSRLPTASQAAPVTSSTTGSPAKPRPDRFASTDAFGDDDDSDGSGGGMFDDSVPLLPGQAEDADLSVVASLPPHMQTEYVEELRRKYRAGTRGKLLPVAADPAAFAHAQLAAFLRVAKFNTAVDRLNAAQAGSAESGKRIASEADKKYLLFDDALVGGDADDAASADEGAAVERREGENDEDGAKQDADMLPPLRTALSLSAIVGTAVPATFTSDVTVLANAPSDRDRLRLFLGSSAASRPSRGGGWGARGSVTSRGRGRGRDRLADRMTSSRRDVERSIAFIEGRGSGRGGAMSEHYEHILRSSAATLGNVSSPGNIAVNEESEEREMLPLDSLAPDSLADDLSIRDTYQLPAIQVASTGAADSEDDDLERAVALSLQVPCLSSPTRHASDGGGTLDIDDANDDDDDAGGFIVGDSSGIRVADVSAARATFHSAVSALNNAHADSASDKLVARSRDDQEVPILDVSASCVAHRSQIIEGDKSVADVSSRASGGIAVASPVIDASDDEWEDANETAVRIEVSVAADAEPDGAISVTGEEDPSRGTVFPTISPTVGKASPPSQHSPRGSFVGSGSETSGLPTSMSDVKHDGTLRDLGDAATEDAAIAEAFELAGSMHSWAKRAFAQALKSVGRSIPIAGATASVAAEVNDAHTAEPVTAAPDNPGDCVSDNVDEGSVVAAGQLPGQLVPELTEIEAEESRATGEVRGAARIVGEISETIKEEVMALLRLCGVPYIVAPMEAEAQCAELERAGVVQGVVTDDSDAFLFGATVVYRNIFESSKFVEVYAAAEIERELGLTRDDLVRLALLLGSDYTEGVRGIGPVNALEVLRAFPGDDGLVAFREWLHSVLPDPARGRSGLERGDAAAAFKATHSAGRRNWQVSDSFPNAAVLASYRRPAVRELSDDALASVTWALPDLEGLRLLAQDRFGWTRESADAELLPMMREQTSGAVQTSIAPFIRTYADGDRAARIRSVRLRAAVEGITGASADEIAVPQSGSSSRRGDASSVASLFDSGSSAAISSSLVLPAKLAGQKHGASSRKGARQPKPSKRRRRLLPVDDPVSDSDAASEGGDLVKTKKARVVVDDATSGSEF